VVGVRALVEAILAAIVVPETGVSGVVAGGLIGLLGLLLVLSAGYRRRRRQA
jgi:LPXTG-motif cell wall-anchored protein